MAIWYEIEKTDKGLYVSNRIKKNASIDREL